MTRVTAMSAEVNANGTLRKLECNGILVNLYVGNEVEGGPTNLYLRRLPPVGAAPGELEAEYTPLLGPASATRFNAGSGNAGLEGVGTWHGINYRIALVLAENRTAWFWHVALENTGSAPARIDLTLAHDIALASYGAIRLNEFYVSQYLDHTPLTHAGRGVMLATRQNQAVDGKYPWSLVGSLRRGEAFATDAMQMHGLALRAGRPSPGLSGDLPSRRLQHEHAMVIVRDSVIELTAGERASAGFFGLFVADHPDATGEGDLKQVDAVLALGEAAAPEALAPESRGAASTPQTSATLFSGGAQLQAHELDDGALRTLFGSERRHEERDSDATLLSFFYGDDAHVVMQRKELRVMRPHGHVLRSGLHLSPDESALTTTAWMSGVFHSMVTQGHVSINRFLSTTHSYIGLFRSHGQRVFVEIDGAWRLLNVPSAFEIRPDACRWVYRHDGGIIEVRSQAHSAPHRLSLSIEVTQGAPARFLISYHVAMNGDDGSVEGAARMRRDGARIVIGAAAGGDVAYRFPEGTFAIAPGADTKIAQVGGDELLFADGRSRKQPFVCLVSEPSSRIWLEISGGLISEAEQHPLRVASRAALSPVVGLRASATTQTGDARAALSRLIEIVPWFAQNALVHYLSPRGLEQYSGGGWGTRDVCQGPVEMLLALGRVEPIRDLLLRVLRQQNPDGDWPQWFMFFERERNIRPGDSHGDIVFWPLLVLAEYLIASADAAVLDEVVPFFDGKSPEAGERATVWQHAQRALALIGKRVIAGTALAAYGHGDWNDSLQPADPKLREHMCSAWTVVLHHQMLQTLASALRGIHRESDAVVLERSAEGVRRDFQRLLLVDGVLTGYAIFDGDAEVRYLLHPRDRTTGIRYSALAMIHAILEDLLTPEQTRAHLELIEKALSACDGVRLFDRPMTYHGGPQYLFQRAESATYFGREIGLMYMHAHLRFAQALAHIGEAERFFHALCQANPIGIRAVVPQATLRQANCYYSSSDAAFADRYQASAEYARVAEGTIGLDGGWRVYSSGAGIALGLIVRHLFGLSCEASALCIDPVMPSALDGLEISTALRDRPVDVRYRIGAAGCGVRSLTLNGTPLSFKREANPHRPGAARVALSDVTALFAQGINRLDIEIG